MRSIEMLIDSVSQHLTEAQNSQEAIVLTIVLKYAYSQLQLRKDKAKNCGF